MICSAQVLMIWIIPELSVSTNAWFRLCILIAGNEPVDGSQTTDFLFFVGR